MTLSTPHDPVVGLGWRQPHYQALIEQSPRLAFIEVHSENFFAAGGAALQVLQAGRERWPVSLHCVGLGLGSAAGLDPGHLERLAALVERIDPVRVSDHASFARGQVRVSAGPGPGPGQAGDPVPMPVHANDLLPVAFTHGSLALMVRQVQQVQERLRRPILVENLSACVAWAEADMSEAAYLAALCRHSGCGLLLDVNNLYVNALNDGAPAPLQTVCETIDALPAGIVGEIHLAGHRDLGDIVIDDHGSRVIPPVWAAYEHALRRFGTVPTLIEWDTDLPPLAVLLDEVRLAEAVVAQVRGADAEAGGLPAPGGARAGRAEARA